jgi:hypothetical protein
LPANLEDLKLGEEEIFHLVYLGRNIGWSLFGPETADLNFYEKKQACVRRF